MSLNFSFESPREDGESNPKFSFPQGMCKPSPTTSSQEEALGNWTTVLAFFYISSSQNSIFFPSHSLDCQITHILIEGNIRGFFFFKYIETSQVYDMTTLAEFRDINKSMVKPILTDVVVVVVIE